LVWLVLQLPVWYSCPPPQGFHEFEIRRDNLLADSFAVLDVLAPELWRRRFKIKFKDEDGLDAGGLSKDWCARSADDNRA
jgi:hypothetical protein